MLNDAKDLQAVYIVCGYTDLRKGIDSLSNIISQTYGMDPFQPGTLFMFCGRKTDRIKALIWEGDDKIFLSLSFGCLFWQPGGCGGHGGGVQCAVGVGVSVYQNGVPAVCY